MPAGIEVNYTGRGTDFIPTLPMTLRMVVQKHPRFIVNSINDYNYNSMLFEADESAYTKVGSNVYWTANNTVWNNTYTTSFTPYGIPRLIETIFMRPTVDGKTICISDVYKDYDNSLSHINFLSTPNTSISLIEVGSLNVATIPSKYIEVKHYLESFFDQEGKVIFNQDTTKYAVVPIIGPGINYGSDTTSAQFDPGLQASLGQGTVSRIAGGYNYVDIPIEYDMSKVYVSTFGCYCNHIDTNMLGVAIKYVGRRIYFKYYNSPTWNNSDHKVSHFMPTISNYQYRPSIYLGYFPNFL